MTFDTPEGRAWLDVAMCRLGDSGPGDVLVIRYGGGASRMDALEFRRELCEAAQRLPKGALKHPVPAVVAREGVSWAFEHVIEEEP